LTTELFFSVFYMGRSSGLKALQKNDAVLPEYLYQLKRLDLGEVPSSGSSFIMATGRHQRSAGPSTGRWGVR
jgi:hypothetical protein